MTPIAFLQICYGTAPNDRGLMISTSAVIFFDVGFFGLALLVVQYFIARQHLRNPASKRMQQVTGISVLKPLCGVDDELETNLAVFAHLNYSNYELLLGVKDKSDPAFSIACKAARRWPNRVRVVIQQDSTGLNPKVNQLTTLMNQARHDLLVISDSNVRVSAQYLNEIADYFGELDVGLVTHPVVGVAENSLGAWFDNLQLITSIAPGVIAAMRLAGQPIVVGKSMAFRKVDLQKLGGFASLKNVLAEDYIAGKLVSKVLQKRVVIAHQVVRNVTRNKTLEEFYQRYTRWSIMQRHSVGLPLYFGMLALNPICWATAGIALHPSAVAFVAWAGIAAAKVLIDLNLVSLMRGSARPWWRFVLVPAKDLLMFLAWLKGLLTDEICWRGNRFRVLPGTVLVPLGVGDAATQAGLAATVLE